MQKNNTQKKLILSKPNSNAYPAKILTNISMNLVKTFTGTIDHYLLGPSRTVTHCDFCKNTKMILGRLYAINFHANLDVNIFLSSSTFCTNKNQK